MRHSHRILRTAALLVAASAAAGLASPASAQGVDQDSLRRAQLAQIDQHRALVAAGAAVFLDRALTPTERLAAVRGIAAFAESLHVAGAARIALDTAESLPIRVRALELVGHRMGTDTSFARAVLPFVADSTTALELRREAATQTAFATFGSSAFHAMRERFLQALRNAAVDPDLEVRRAALRALAGQGDEAALRLLERGLVTPGDAGLPPSEAVHLLGLNDPTPFFAVLHGVMREPPDSATRLAAIRLLGGYEPSRADLVALLRDPQESPAARHAALGALAAGDPQGLAERVAPVVADEGAPLDLRLRAIKAVEIIRTSRDPRVLGRVPDEFDRTLERLAERSSTLAVRDAARGYLDRTRTAR
jgi:hypothetical protein